MPSLCAYKMCHNLASSSWSGYCNQAHYERAKLEELKEQIKKLEEVTKQVKEEGKKK
jgi:predicted DNA-binding transcriptional regulator